MLAVTVTLVEAVIVTAPAPKAKLFEPTKVNPVAIERVLVVVSAIGEPLVLSIFAPETRVIADELRTAGPLMFSCPVTDVAPVCANACPALGISVKEPLTLLTVKPNTTAAVAPANRLAVAPVKLRINAPPKVGVPGFVTSVVKVAIDVATPNVHVPVEPGP